jgi:hypothetical protein
MQCQQQQITLSLATMLKQAGSALLSTTGSLLQQASAGLQVQQTAFYASKPFTATLFPGDGMRVVTDS